MILKLKKLFVTLILSIILILSGCASKKEILVKTEYKEVKIPVKCSLKIPAKPKFNNDFKSAKELSKYYLETERIAKLCTGENF